MDIEDEMGVFSNGTESQCFPQVGQEWHCNDYHLLDPSCRRV
jgi:hypothetical protein